jgi:hypothetical protein
MYVYMTNILKYFLDAHLQRTPIPSLNMHKMIK